MIYIFQPDLKNSSCAVNLGKYFINNLIMKNSKNITIIKIVKYKVFPCIDEKDLIAKKVYDTSN